jgi:hypothetical protein
MAEGAPNGSACVCAPGFFQHVDWAGAGDDDASFEDPSFDDATPRGACALCAPGSFSTGLGAASCEDCGAAAFLARDAALGERACVPCPGNASAVPRALGVEGCVALAGFVRVAGAGARVELAVLWPGSAAAFAAAEAAFRRGLAAAGAAACRCGAASARVARVTAAAAARRLLQDFVEGVVVEVELGVADAGSGSHGGGHQRGARAGGRGAGLGDRVGTDGYAHPRFAYALPSPARSPTSFAIARCCTW